MLTPPERNCVHIRCLFLKYTLQELGLRTNLKSENGVGGEVIPVSVYNHGTVMDPECTPV